MAKSKSKRKTRSDKFPLILHRTGQFCKKIKGKIYYFGTDKQVVLNRYLEQAVYLHTGKQAKPKSAADELSIKKLCNLYLDHQESRVAIGEIKPRHISDQVSLMKRLVRFVRPYRIVSGISTIDLQNYRKQLIKADKSANTVNNRIAVVKAMYNWALDNEIIDDSPRLKAAKKITPPKREKPTFTGGKFKNCLRMRAFR